jgi:4-methyl-5(b-hydroxyethyl)-thiazole monophosphate biosynthesis
MKRACLALAEGFEEVEAVTPIDYLRRAGVEVSTFCLAERSVRGGHGIVVMADMSMDELAGDYDCVILPGGGGGAAALAADPRITRLVRRHFAAGALVAAICAAPALVLHGSCGILAGRRFTCYPGLESRVTGATFSDERVVVDGNLVTARSAGCSGEFAYAIASILVGAEAAKELSVKVLLRQP